MADVAKQALEGETTVPYRRESLFNIIRERFGDRHKRLARSFEYNHIKRARLQNHLKFAKRCRNEHLIPRGMKSHVSKQDKNNPNILKLIKKTELERKMADVENQAREGEPNIN